MNSRAEAKVKPTVVLVHGAWADGSSWSAVTEQLQRGGFAVAVAPNGLRGWPPTCDTSRTTWPRSGGGLCSWGIHTGVSSSPALPRQ
jgi:hypothetical protein